MDLPYLLENIAPFRLQVIGELSAHDFASLSRVSKKFRFLAPELCSEATRSLSVFRDLPNFREIWREEKIVEFYRVKHWIESYFKNIETLVIAYPENATKNILFIENYLMALARIFIPENFPRLKELVVDHADTGLDMSFVLGAFSQPDSDLRTEKLQLLSWSSNTDGLVHFAQEKRYSLTEFVGKFTRFDQCKSAWDILCSLPEICKISIEIDSAEVDRGISTNPSLQNLLFPYGAHARVISPHLQSLTFKSHGIPRHSSSEFGRQLIAHVITYCPGLRVLRVDFSNVAYNCLEGIRSLESLEVLEFVFDTSNEELLESFFAVRGPGLREIRCNLGTKFTNDVLSKVGLSHRIKKYCTEKLEKLIFEVPAQNLVKNRYLISVEDRETRDPIAHDVIAHDIMFACKHLKCVEMVNNKQSAFVSRVTVA